LTQLLHYFPGFVSDPNVRAVDGTGQVLRRYISVPQ